MSIRIGVACLCSMAMAVAGCGGGGSVESTLPTVTASGSPDETGSERAVAAKGASDRQSGSALPALQSDPPSALAQSLARSPSGTRSHLLWQDETTTGYDQAYAVAASERWVATAGAHFHIGPCVRGTGCGLDASLRVYDAKSGALRWTSEFDLGATADRNQAVAIAKDVILTVGTSQNVSLTNRHIWWVMSAFDARTGTLLWRDVIGDKATDYYPWQIALQGKTAYVTGLAGATCATGADSLSCDQFTRAYDIATGRVIWTNRADFAGGDDETLSVAATENGIYVAGVVGRGPADPAGDESVRALDPRNGRVLWEDVIHDPTGDGFVFKVVADDERVVIGAISNDDWLIRAYDAETGAVLWTQTYARTGVSTPGVFDAPVQLAMQEGVVVAAGYGSTKVFGTEPYPKASRDWVVNGYDAKSGRLLWSDVYGAPDDIDEANGGVVIAQGQAIAWGFTVTIDAAGNKLQQPLLRSYDVHTGRIQWQDLIPRTGFPFGVTITLATDGERVTAASYVKGTRPPGATPPDSFGVNLLVRTYDVRGHVEADE